MSRTAKKGQSRSDRLSTFEPGKVALGYCRSDTVDGYFHDSLILLLWREKDRIQQVIPVRSGPKVDDARNEIMEHWLVKTKAEWLLMVDTDMVLPVDIVDRLIRHERPIVGALAMIGRPGQAHTNLRVVKRNGDGTATMTGVDKYEKGLVEVDGTGTACLLIHREVGVRMWEARGWDDPMPWFRFGMHGKVPIGEDVAFCLTARAMGYPIYVDTTVCVGHVKPYILTEKDLLLTED